MGILYIFVEGNDDERFYRWYFNNKNVSVIKYAQEKRDKINNFIKSIKKIPNVDYIFTADTDGKSLEEKKGEIIRLYSNCEYEKIVVAQMEIESWYLAGLDQAMSTKFRIKYYISTDNIAKENFKDLVPKSYSPMSFMIEILKSYNLEVAITKNLTFRCFYTEKKREALDCFCS